MGKEKAVQQEVSHRSFLAWPIWSLWSFALCWPLGLIVVILRTVGFWLNKAMLQTLSVISETDKKLARVLKIKQKQ